MPVAQQDDRSRTRGRNCEEAFLIWATKCDATAPRAYLPVQWWQCAVRHAIANGVAGFEAVPVVQQFLDTLDASRPYFTVSRGDDGIYERLPPDTVVFGAGGDSDFAVPLLPPSW